MIAIDSIVDKAPDSRYFCGLGSDGFHRIHYTEWNADQQSSLICVHGLTRNGRDFDVLAHALSDTYRVLCPDVVGRGRSGWLKDGSGYSYPQYLADMTALIARSGTAEVDWVGTSMGGLIGMLLASQPNSPIRRLVINDVGAFVPGQALRRIADYLGKTVAFADLDELEQHLRVIAAPFGPLSDEQWRHLAHHSSRTLENDRLTYAYDPAIAEPFGEALDDIDLWSVWERVRCPTLLLRGAESDLLRREDAERMTQSGPRATLVEFDGVGHAPALMADDQVKTVRDWLRRG